MRISVSISTRALSKRDMRLTLQRSDDPNVYQLQDHEGETIIGKFYEEELSAVDKKDDDSTNSRWNAIWNTKTV